jgi:hypothetical protein
MNRNVARNFILILIILLGAYFRLSHIELTKFSSDQGRQLQIAKDGLVDGNIILAGCSSHLGIRHGAIVQYLLTYPMILSDDPEASIFFLALLSLLTIYIVYRIGNDFFSWRIGIIAAALFSTSHVAVTMARYLNSEPLLSPLLGALLVYTLLKIVNNKSAFYSFVLPILAIILVLSHSSNLVVVMFLAITALLYRNSIKIRYAVGGFLTGLILLIPYFIYLLTNGLLKLSLLRGFIRAYSNLSGKYSLIIDFRGPIAFFQIFGYNYPAYKATLFDWSMMFLFIFGVIIFIYRVSLKYILAREKPYLRIAQFPNETIILISIFTPLIVFPFLQGWNPNYYLGQVPLMFILMAVAARYIISRFKNRFAGYLLIFGIMLIQSIGNINNWMVLNTQGEPELYRDEKATVNFIIRDAGNKPFVFSLSHNHIGDVEPHWLYLFETKNIKPVQIKSVPSGTMLYYVSNNKSPVPASPISRFGEIKIFKQELNEDIKTPYLQKLKYSFRKDNGWELSGFDDSLWDSFLSAEKIPAKAEVIYIRAILIVPEGIKHESVQVEMNGYLLDAYIRGKKIRLSDSRFILRRGIISGPLIKKLARVAYETGTADSLGPGSYSVCLRILIPEEYSYLNTQTEYPGFKVFNVK